MKVVIFALLLAVPFAAHAIGLPFGGFVSFAKPCPVGAGQYIIVKNINPLFGGTYVIIPTTISYPFFIVKPFSYVLGTYIPSPNITCGVPARGYVLMKGNSLGK